MLLENKSFMFLEVSVIWFRNIMQKRDMLNPKRTRKNKIAWFWFNVFNLLTRWLGHKLQSQSNLKKKSLYTSQLIEDK